MYRKIMRIIFGFWLNLKLGRANIMRADVTYINVTKVVVTYSRKSL